MLDSLFFSALAPLLPGYIEQHSLSPLHTGLLVAADAIGGICAVPFAALAVRRMGPRAPMLFGLLTAGAASLVFGLAQTAWLLDLSRLLLGAGSAFAWSAGLTWLVRAVSRERRARSIGLVLGSAAAGSILGPALGALAASIGTGVAFGAVAACCLALAGAGALVPGAGLADPGGRPFKELLRGQPKRQLALLSWIVTLPALLVAVLIAQVPPRLDELELTAPAIGSVFVVAATIEVILSPLVGHWADRHGRLGPLRAGTLVAAVGAILIPWPAQSGVAVALTIVVAVGAMLLAGPSLTLLADCFEAMRLPYEVAFAGQNLSWGIGHLTGALGAGFLAGAVAPWVPFAVTGGLALVTCAGLWFVPGGMAASYAGKSG